MHFTETHEWLVVNGTTGIVGISNHAQKELGDIVYVELPEIGKSIKAGEVVAVLESTKAAVDVYSPISGKITEINELLKTNSELINQSPEKEGWLYKIEVQDLKEVDSLMDLKSYQTMVN